MSCGPLSQQSIEPKKGQVQRCLLKTPHTKRVVLYLTTESGRVQCCVSLLFLFFLILQTITKVQTVGQRPNSGRAWLLNVSNICGRQLHTCECGESLKC